MTDSSGLLQEIEEDLQRQKYEKLWRQYGKYIIAGALAIVLVTALVNGWRSWRIYSEQKASGALLTIVEDKNVDKGKQIEALESFARVHSGMSQSVIARLRAAMIAIKENKKEQGIGIYDALAADTNVEVPFRQLADLLSVQAQLDTGDPAILRTRLQPLITDSPWRASAMEFSALLALRAGDREAAKKLYLEITNTKDAPASILQRAEDMQRWLGEAEGK